MAIKNKQFLKDYWAKIPSEIRKEKMKLIAHKRWDNVSKTDKKMMGKKLAEARKNAKSIAHK